MAWCRSSVRSQRRHRVVFKRTGTVLRAAYSRTIETPFNENLLLSSATGIGGLAEQRASVQHWCPSQLLASATSSTAACSSPSAGISSSTPIISGKYTHNAYDFSTLLNTTITFPIAWHNSKIDGFTGALQHHQR